MPDPLNAHIEIQMASVGIEPPCTGCGKPWNRGQRMSGVRDSEGEGAGWYCDACIEKWKREGQQPIPEETTDA